LQNADKDNSFCSCFSLNCRGTLRQFRQGALMGILNATPDSFFAGSRVARAVDLLEKAALMLEEGADLLDLGAVSTRPGAPELSMQEETERLFPLLIQLRKNFPDAVISVDTWRASVAREAVNLGADMINDISAGSFDPLMPETIASLNVPVVLMHSPAKPRLMQQHTEYNALVQDVLFYLSERVHHYRSLGVSDIIADPGFGFGKTASQNFELLAGLSRFRFLNVPILVGVSRKSMIYRTLEIDPEDALNGTTAAHMLALSQGADILRVHDVKEARQARSIFQEYAQFYNTQA
jgi:dihydropteroate synthase